MTLPILQVTDLHVSREGQEILRGLNLEVQPGTVHAILGLNGSGKSTLAYTLIGSSGYSASQGEILLDGEPITHLNISERAQRGLTLAWQEPARFEGLTVERYIGLGMKAPSREGIAAALDEVALDSSYMRRNVDEALSGGERKRVELAAVAAMRPKVAILDEPDSGIDALTLDDITAVLRRMVTNGSTVVVISHNDKVVATADVASMVCEGRVVMSGPAALICERYGTCCQPCERRNPVESEADYERL